MTQSHFQLRTSLNPLFSEWNCADGVSLNPVRVEKLMQKRWIHYSPASQTTASCVSCSSSRPTLVGKWMWISRWTQNLPCYANWHNVWNLVIPQQLLLELVGSLGGNCHMTTYFDNCQHCQYLDGEHISPPMQWWQQWRLKDESTVTEHKRWVLVKIIPRKVREKNYCSQSKKHSGKVHATCAQC